MFSIPHSKKQEVKLTSSFEETINAVENFDLNSLKFLIVNEKELLLGFEKVDLYIIFKNALNILFIKIN